MITLDNPNPEDSPVKDDVEGISVAPKDEPTGGAKAVFPPKTDNPKSKQFTGRATEKEFERINEALDVRRPAGKTYDIVRLALDMLNHIENDIFQTFRTKKKR